MPLGVLFQWFCSWLRFVPIFSNLFTAGRDHLNRLALVRSRTGARMRLHLEIVRLGLETVYAEGCRHLILLKKKDGRT